MKQEIEVRQKNVKRVWFNDDTNELYDKVAYAELGVDAVREGRWTFIPWQSIKKIDGEIEYY